MRGLSTVRFTSGQVVYTEGEPSDALYFMLGPSAEDLEAGAQDDEHSELTVETHEKGVGAGRVCPFAPSKRYFGEEGLVYRCGCLRVNFFVLVSIDRARRPMKQVGDASR